MKIITYNVNGIRAAINKGLAQWLQSVNADVVCLQEVKAELEQIDPAVFENLGYKIYWYAAEKKGYSGVAILSKTTPNHVQYGSGFDAYDREGRFIRVDYADVSVLCTYFPSGSSGDERQAFKMQFLDDYYSYSMNLISQHPNLIVCGDYNICHKAIDIHNPKSNAKTSGFLPEERNWMEKLMTSGFHDAFRHVNQEPHQYTWWSLRSGARSRNLGWRIDYHLVTEAIKNRIQRCVILPDAQHSDHCPVLLEIN
jgi:exodeoxyribonuclease III